MLVHNVFVPHYGRAIQYSWRSLGETTSVIERCMNIGIAEWLNVTRPIVISRPRGSCGAQIVFLVQITELIPRELF